MFELSFIRKYLIPRRKQLSVSLIAIMSVCVISLVVWLTLVFLSVTEGMERGWLKKLTSLNAPVRLTPTSAYYQSYYHLIDSLAYESGYQAKSLREKWLTSIADPYDPEVDAELPGFLKERVTNKDGSLKDLVKETFVAIDSSSDQLQAAPFEITGGLLKLRMIHPEFDLPGEEQQNYLTQVAYISSFPENNPNLPKLLLPPKASEIDHLFHMAALSSEGVLRDEANLAQRGSREVFQKKVERLIANVQIQEVVPFADWAMPYALLPEGVPFQAKYSAYGSKIDRITLQEGGSVSLTRKGKFLFLDGKKVHNRATLCLNTPIPFTVLSIEEEDSQRVSDLQLQVEINLQGKRLTGKIPYYEVALAKISAKQRFVKMPDLSPPWPYFIEETSTLHLPEESVVLAKNYQESGVQVGDLGYLSYGAQTTSGVQEQRVPIRVAGFYDPGIMPIGNKCLFTDPELVTAIRSANHSYTLDRSLSTGIQVWTKDLDQADALAEKIRTQLEEKGLSPFWHVQSFRQYDFAKDLLQQFESDKYLFTLIGIIILIVACTNIISLLSLLVNDKKEEIAILQAMGASKKHIATIFAGSGVVLGLIGSVMGTLLAILTLHNIEQVAGALSFLQGREAFNSTFYGSSLPSDLSQGALYFILISTPIISLVAGLVPALKACRLRPAEVLK